MHTQSLHLLPPLNTSRAHDQEFSDKEKYTSAVQNTVYEVEDTPERTITKHLGLFGPFISKLFDAGVEARGIERVLENQRDSKQLWNNLLMWWSVNMVLPMIPVGVLGQFVFALTLPHSIAIILCFGALGSITTAFSATLGPKTGLRTMIISRYSSGYIGCTFYSILNILTQFGFAVTTAIAGGQMLASINPNALSLISGIIIMGICSLVPSLIGYNMVHAYERYAWIITFVIVCCLYGLGNRAGYDMNAQKALENTGIALRADVLGFGSAIFGASCWVNVAADYTVRLPAETNPWHVFVMTFWGVYLPVVFTATLGATLMTITNPTYVAAFGINGDTGALIAKVLSPWGAAGKFFLVMLAFSAISTNIISAYSAALSIQALGRPFTMVPRFVWVLLVVVVYTIMAVAGREHFAAILNNVLTTLSYWTAIFTAILAEEHLIFRRKGGRLGGYNLADWDRPSKLPMGIAGTLAWCFGVVGAVVGISQTWYLGPIGKMAGGADLGFELAAGFAGVVFLPLRWMEIRLTGR